MINLEFLKLKTRVLNSPNSIPNGRQFSATFEEVCCCPLPRHTSERGLAMESYHDTTMHDVAARLIRATER